MSVIKNGVEFVRTIMSDGITEAIVDVVSRCLAVVDIAHWRIHRGEHYEIVDYVDLTAAGSREFIFVTPNTDVRIHFVHEISFEKESTVVMTRGVATSNDGTLVPSFNNDHNSANTSVMVVTHTPSGVSGGTVILQHRKGDGNKAGGLSRGENENILLKNTKYSIKITDQSAQNSLTNWSYEWYEA